MLRCNVCTQCVLLILSVLIQSLHLSGSLVLLQDMALLPQQQLHCAVYKYQAGPVTMSAHLHRLTPMVASRLIKAAPTDSSIKAARMATVNSQAIRKHFVELTRALLMPFAPYCHPLGPPPDPASGQPDTAPGEAVTLDQSVSALQQSAVAPGQLGAAPGQVGAAPGQSEGGYVARPEPPLLPAFSHAEFIEQLQASQLPAVLLQRFRSQASMCHVLLLYICLLCLSC